MAIILGLAFSKSQNVSHIVMPKYGKMCNKHSLKSQK